MLFNIFNATKELWLIESYFVIFFIISWKEKDAKIFTNINIHMYSH